MVDLFEHPGRMTITQKAFFSPNLQKITCKCFLPFYVL